MRAVLSGPEQPVDLVEGRVVAADRLVALDREIEFAVRKPDVVRLAARPDLHAPELGLRVEIDDRDTVAGTRHERECAVIRRRHFMGTADGRDATEYRPGDRIDDRQRRSRPGAGPVGAPVTRSARPRGGRSPRVPQAPAATESNVLLPSRRSSFNPGLSFWRPGRHRYTPRDLPRGPDMFVAPASRARHPSCPNTQPSPSRRSALVVEQVPCLTAARRGVVA